jgi:O-antigen/teichoic acid export membrane protein
MKTQHKREALSKTPISRLLPHLNEGLSIAISMQKLRTILHTSLYTSSSYLLTNSIVIAGLGFLFWIVVARVYPPEAVGLGSALISAAIFLSFIASVGLSTGLVRFLPSWKSEPQKLINSCLTWSGLVAAGLAGVFLAGLPLWSPALKFVRESQVFVWAFIAFVIMNTVLDLLVGVFVALRATKLVLLGNLVSGLTKVILAFTLMSHFKILGIFASAAIGVAFALGLSLFLFLPRLIPGYRLLSTSPAEVSGDMLRFSFVNYLGTAFWNAPTWVFPIMVVNVLGGQNTAYFYISWSMAALLFAIPGATSTSLFAEGSYPGSSLKNNVMRSLKLIAVLLLPTVAIVPIVGGKLLFFFGNEYSSAGQGLLWIVSASALPLAVNMVYIGVAKVKKSLMNIILLSAGIALGSLVLGYLLIPPFGIMGPGIGYLVANTLAALIALTSIVKLLRAEPSQVLGRLGSEDGVS